MNKFIICILIIILLFRQIIYANSDNNTYINSSNIKYDEKNNIVELSKNSKINIDNTNILVDRGIIDYKNNKFEVFGNFYLYQDLNILSGFNLVGDTNLDSFKAENVSYIYNNELKIDADKIYKNADYLYFYNNFITPCEIEGVFNCPTWSIRVDETKYDLNEDKYTHYDSFLQIADYKLIYLPYFSHYGAKAPRKKGFLTPSIVFNLEGGTSLKTPYYYPLNQSTDFTITPIIKLSSNLNLTEKVEEITCFPIFVSKKIQIPESKNIFLTGDAFYSFPPSFAQGASQSIEAANELFNNIKNNSLSYYKTRILKTKQISSRSSFNHFAFHLSNPLNVFFRDIFLKYLSKNKNFLENYLGKIYNN